MHCDNVAMLVVEVGALLVAAVSLLLQRLDRRKDELPGLGDALIQLHKTVTDWATVAAHVNEALEAAVESGEPQSGPFSAFDGFKMQLAYSQALQDQLRSDESGGDRIGAAQMLSVYAPEVRNTMLRAAEIRQGVVADLMRDYDAAAAAGSVRRQDLKATAENLRTAGEELRLFITSNFPIRNL